MSLGSVAIRISRDLKEVIFVGAFAVICHIGPYRRTRDIDLALASFGLNQRLFRSALSVEVGCGGPAGSLCRLIGFGLILGKGGNSEKDHDESGFHAFLRLEIALLE